MLGELPNPAVSLHFVYNNGDWVFCKSLQDYRIIFYQNEDVY